MGELPTSIEPDPATQAELLLLDQEFDANYAEAFAETDHGTWVLAANAYPELQEAARREVVTLLGGMAIRGAMETHALPEKPNKSSLMAATQLAAMGDEAALRVVTTNAATDVAERLFKAKHQTKVEMEFINGHLEQDDRRLIDVHQNTLEHATLNDEMLHKTKIELHNAVLAEQLFKAGVLAENNVLFVSAASTTMTVEEKRSYGMFVDTDSCSMQLLIGDGNHVTLETAFVAGKVSPNAERHDIKAIQAMAEVHGITIPTSDGTEILQYVMLIPKEQAPGVASVVEWYDDAAGGTFYGLDEPRQDYQAYAEVCYERAKDFDGMVQGIVSQLISEAHTFAQPMDAILRLDELSAAASRQRALHDESIDVAVFGHKAAAQIQEARFFMERGQLDRAEAAMAKAAEYDQSGACPLFKNSSVTGNEGSGPSGSQEEAGGKKWGHCPYCKALVFVDPCAKRISCWDCTAMVLNGKVISMGNGGTRKRREEAEARRAEQEARAATQVDAIFKEQGSESTEDAKQSEGVAPAGSLALANA